MGTVFRNSSHRFGTRLILHFIPPYSPAPFLKMKKAGILMASHHKNPGRFPNDKFLKTL